MRYFIQNFRPPSRSSLCCFLAWFSVSPSGLRFPKHSKGTSSSSSFVLSFALSSLLLSSSSSSTEMRNSLRSSNIVERTIVVRLGAKTALCSSLTCISSILSTNRASMDSFSVSVFSFSILFLKADSTAFNSLELSGTYLLFLCCRSSANSSVDSRFWRSLYSTHFGSETYSWSVCLHRHPLDGRGKCLMACRSTSEENGIDSVPNSSRNFLLQ
mmetsp:Transcript_26423/g.72667  ORF Transcript_26423/g.72667 Transcript_26423/m.72667 type:complete len:214 (-) Transcript_26423:1427-2068(-)